MSKLNISLILAIVVLSAIVVSGAEIRIKIGSDDLDGVELNQSSTLVRNQPESEAIQQIASSGADIPVLMMNLNKYKTDADYPNGSLYKNYMNKLMNYSLRQELGFSGEPMLKVGLLALKILMKLSLSGIRVIVLSFS